MEAIDAVRGTIGTVAACDALGLSRATVYRARQPAPPRVVRPAPPRALTPSERRAVLDLLHTERFVDQAPAQVHAALLDDGVYLCSPRTMYRLLDAAGEVQERRNHVSRPAYAKPELLATRPNELWSWDITTAWAYCGAGTDRF
jgi:putative transposase